MNLPPKSRTVSFKQKHQTASGLSLRPKKASTEPFCPFPLSSPTSAVSTVPPPHPTPFLSCTVPAGADLHRPPASSRVTGPSPEDRKRRKLSPLPLLLALFKPWLCIYPLLPQTPGGSDGKASVYNAGDPVRSLGWEDPLEKEMATHSSTLAWKIPWTEDLGRLHSMGSLRVGHD